MKRSRWRHLKNKWVIAIAIFVIVIAVITWWKSGNKPATFESAIAAIGNVVETVSVTGTISPVGKADLAFEKSGVITHIYVKVGDTVKKGQSIASLDDASDRAAVASAQATLDDLSRNLTPEELSVQTSAVGLAQTALTNAESDALNAAHDGYVKAQNAVFNYADTFFANPQTVNPVINLRTQSSSQTISIDSERIVISDLFSAWSNDIGAATPAVAANLITTSSSRLQTIKGFMSDLSLIVNDLSPGDSGMSQSQVNAAIGAMNQGLSTLNTAIDSVTAASSEISSAQNSLDQAKSNYNLKLSGNSSQSIAAQSAKVEQAKAILAEDIVTSPIDGVVTKADPNVGEFAAAGQSGFAVENSEFKVEAFVPEADIAKIVVGNTASSTLDAYGSGIDFPATVTMIDPAETVIEGVPTYKVTLKFVMPDARIRSGMTANLEIHTHERDGVVTIPYRAVVSDAVGKTVRRVNADGKTYASISVTTGLKGSDGTIEIVSGLNPGETVVTYVK
jgi:RND family efflux transporter MFP subunit